jgi:hypothetical protein
MVNIQNNPSVNDFHPNAFASSAKVTSLPTDLSTGFCGILRSSYISLGEEGNYERESC